MRDWLCGVEAARLAAKMAGAGLRMGVFPHLYADGVTLPQSWESAAYQKVPVMLLSGTTEFSFARWDAFFASETAQTFPAEELEQAKPFAVQYGSALYRVFNAQTPAGLLAGWTGAPVYLAQADYGAPGSGTEIPLLGSFHGIFLPMLSPSNAYTAWADFSQAGFAEMAGQFRRSLRNFLTSGDPNGKTLVSARPGGALESERSPRPLTGRHGRCCPRPLSGGAYQRRRSTGRSGCRRHPLPRPQAVGHRERLAGPIFLLNLTQHSKKPFAVRTAFCLTQNTLLPAGPHG